MIKRLIFWNFFLMLITLNSSCTSMKWGDFTSQKHTNLSQIKVKKSHSTDERPETTNASSKCIQIEENDVVPTESANLIEPDFNLLNAQETDQTELEINDGATNKKDLISSKPPKKTSEYQSKEIKTTIHKNQQKSSLGLYWLSYTLLILLATFIFIAGWYGLAFEGGFVFVLMLILAILSMFGIMVHAWIKLIRSEGVEQRKRRALFLYVTGLSLLIITVLITFYFEA